MARIVVRNTGGERQLIDVLTIYPIEVGVHKSFAGSILILCNCKCVPSQYIGHTRLSLRSFPISVHSNTFHKHHVFLDEI
jgi:hypothetical protein